MTDWKNVLIEPHALIRDTIKIIDKHSLQIAVVIDSENRLLGTVTDGDIRRGLINGMSLDDPVQQIMNPNPVSIPKINDRQAIIRILKVNKLRHLPVVDEKGSVIGIELVEDLLHPSVKQNWVVVMAGGLGSRLAPLTNNCPKPMLPIGDKPLLEQILEQFIAQGFDKFCFTIHYKADQIKGHFGDGSKWGVEICYIQEEKRLGTVGALSHFDGRTQDPIIVINGDILTNLNFDQLLSFHNKHKARATIAVRIYDFQIPFGVVKVNKDRLIGFEEKPAFTNLISAGVYVINSELISLIPKGYYDIHQLFETMLAKDESILVFPIREYWTDIGGIDDYNQAQQDFDGVFR